MRTLGESARPLDEAYDAALLDLDGVVYVGDRPVPGAPEALAAARAAGMALAFATNNASRSAKVVAERLTAMGIPANEHEVVTSAQVGVRLLAALVAPGAVVLVCGSDSLRQLVAEAGFASVTRMSEADQTDGRPVVGVINGFDPGLTYADIAEVGYAIQAGAIWVATNLDRTIPQPRGIAPGNGMICEMITAATGATPQVAGKPFRPMHDALVERTGALRPLVVGDRLDTDIEGASNGGGDSLFVFSGVTDLAGLAAAPANQRPTFIGWDLAALLDPHPAVKVDPSGSAASCREALVRCDEDRIEVVAGADGTAGRLDKIRATVALAWALADNGTPVPALPRIAGPRR